MFFVQTFRNGSLVKSTPAYSFEQAMAIFYRRAMIICANKGKVPSDILRNREKPKFSWDDLSIEIIRS